MSTYLDLNSLFRDRESYPSVFDYQVTAEQIKSFYSQPRTTAPVAPKGKRPLEFVTSIRLNQMILPFDQTLSNQALLYVDIHPVNKDSINLISTMNNNVKDAKFNVSFSHIQMDPISGIPLWMHYRCNMSEQVMRWDRDHPLSLRIFDEVGKTVTIAVPDPKPPANPDPFKQSKLLFELTPYQRDTHFWSDVETMGS